MYCAYIYAHKDKDIKIVTIDITMNNKQTFFPQNSHEQNKNT